MKITKVVFIQGCRDEIPQNLIGCLKKALNVTDPKTLTRKCKYSYLYMYKQINNKCGICESYVHVTVL